MILLVTANTMAQSIRERTGELAVLKTLGFGDGRVLSMVLLESCVHRAASAAAPASRCRGSLVALAAIRPGGFLPTFYFPVRDLIARRGARRACSAFVAGAFPAWQAGRLRIVDALRRELTMLSQIIAVTGVNLRSIRPAARVVRRRDHRHRRRRRRVPRRAVDRRGLQGGDGRRRRSADRHRDARRQRHRDDERLRRRRRAPDHGYARASRATQRGPIASPELFVIVGHPTKKDPSDANVPLRGVSSRGAEGAARR